MANKDRFNHRLVEKVGGTSNLFIKGIITVFFPRLFFKNFYKYATNLKYLSKTITISFDCDSYKDVCVLPNLLEYLESYNFKSSFACIGKLIEKYPKEHKLIIENGHEIINHTYSHPFNEELNSLNKFDKLPIGLQREEIVKCHKVCKSILGYEPNGFRIPHFATQYTDTIYSILSELGYSYSSSLLSVKSPTFGAPYCINGILELPIMTCPGHPFQAFDTYHAFRSKLTSHKNEADFLETFEELIKFNLERELYINLYMDPLDIANFENMAAILDCIEKYKLNFKNYNSIFIESVSSCHV